MLTPVELAKLKLTIETRRLNGQKNPWAAPDAAYDKIDPPPLEWSALQYGS